MRSFIVASTFLSFAFFFWMFFASEPLEVLADADRISAPNDTDIHAVAYLFAARWRHGMTEGWPLYMPGFFAVAVSTWFWALRRSVKQMIGQGSVLILLGLVVAAVCQPAGAALMLGDFEGQIGFGYEGAPPPQTAMGVFRGAYTLVTFSAGIVAIQRSLLLWRLWPLLIPLAMNFLLAAIRPWTVDDFTSFWFQQALRFDVVANISFWAIPFLSVILFRSLRPYRSETTSDERRQVSTKDHHDIGRDDRAIKPFGVNPAG